jgi:hypothetical protein
MTPSQPQLLALRPGANPNGGALHSAAPLGPGASPGDDMLRSTASLGSGASPSDDMLHSSAPPGPSASPDGDTHRSAAPPGTAYLGPLVLACCSAPRYRHVFALPGLLILLAMHASSCRTLPNASSPSSPSQPIPVLHVAILG